MRSIAFAENSGQHEEMDVSSDSLSFSKRNHYFGTWDRLPGLVSIYTKE